MYGLVGLLSLYMPHLHVQFLPSHGWSDAMLLVMAFTLPLYFHNKQLLIFGFFIIHWQVKSYVPSTQLSHYHVPVYKLITFLVSFSLISLLIDTVLKWIPLTADSGRVDTLVNVLCLLLCLVFTTTEDDQHSTLNTTNTDTCCMLSDNAHTCILVHRSTHSCQSVHTSAGE